LGEIKSPITDSDFNPVDKSVGFGLNKGHILLFKAYEPDLYENHFGLEFLEDFNCLENPHGAGLDSSSDLKAVSTKLYSFKPNVVSLRFSKNNLGVYVYAIESLQYLYVRNYKKRQNVKQFAMESFPIQIKFDERNEKFLIPLESKENSRLGLILRR
jgi:hypothetical protein